MRDSIVMKCFFCRKTFSYSKRIKNRKYCGIDCQHNSLRGRKLSKKHRSNISIGVKGSLKYYDGLKKRKKINNSGTFKPGDERLLGSNHPMWKGGFWKKDSGYIYKYVPKHPNNVNGYVLEHRLIIEDEIGRFLKSGEVVHHKNGLTDDNRIENLVLFDSQSEHMKHHFEVRRNNA